MNTKFRWFYVPEKKMVYPGDEYLKANMGQEGKLDGYNAKQKCLISRSDIIGPMFWTGLIDMNENPIYEKDIMEGLDCTGIVKWGTNKYMVQRENSCFEYNILLNGWKIMGNEIEHKHLLEAK